MELIRGTRPGAYILALAGVPGVGKSTLANQAEKPVFLDIEGGLDRIDCVRTPRVQSVDEARDYLRELYNEEECKTIVIDSVSQFQDLIRRHVCEKNGWRSIEAPGYGKGFNKMAETFEEFFDVFDSLKANGKNVILIGHQLIQKFKAPDQETYDRYNLQLRDALRETLEKRVDALVFCQYETRTKTTQDERTRAIGTGKRIIVTQETPACVAKNRFNLPPVMDMTPEFFTLLK